MSEIGHLDSLNNWQRLSPLSVLFFISKLVARLIKDALSSLAPAAVVIFNTDNKFWTSIIILSLVVIFVLLGSILQYWFFKFKRDGDKILINDGVFKKNHRIIQFDRIQNINILQPLYFKPFELVTLQIETAGAKGNEADLAGIPKVLAEFVRNEVLKYKSTASSLNASEDSLTADNNEKNIVRASLKDLIKYGVSSNGIFWFFIVLAPLAGMADKVIPQIVASEKMNYLVNSFGGGVLGGILIGLSGFLLIIVFMFGFSVIGAIFRYFNYSLEISGISKNEQTLKRSSGLLSTYEESLKLQKIQAVISQTNFIGKWLKIEHLILGQVSSGQNNTKSKKSLFVIPARTNEQTKEIMNVVYHNPPSEIPTKGINRRYITKTILFKLFIPLLALCFVLYLNTDNFLVFTLPFLLSLLLLPLVTKRWKKYRYGMSQGYGKFERGLFGFRHIVFPLYKVQRAEVRQSPFQRRRNLATLKIYLASNRLQMQYIPIEDANHWMSIIGQEVQNCKLAWF